MNGVELLGTAVNEAYFELFSMGAHVTEMIPDGKADVTEKHFFAVICDFTRVGHCLT